MPGYSTEGGPTQKAGSHDNNLSDCEDSPRQLKAKAKKRLKQRINRSSKSEAIRQDSSEKESETGRSKSAMYEPSMNPKETSAGREIPRNEESDARQSKGKDARKKKFDALVGGLDMPPPDIEEHLDKWWPRPRAFKKLPDELLVRYMQHYGLSPEDFRESNFEDELDKNRARRSRFQMVPSYGKFFCEPPKGCGSTWTSHLTWVRFDMLQQTVFVMGQKCRRCRCADCTNAKKKPAFHRPRGFSYRIWKDACLYAIAYAMNGLHTSSRRERHIKLSGIQKQEYNYDEEELLLFQDLVGPHDQELCERCVFRQGPCFSPHNPKGCKRCRESATGFCFNPEKIINAKNKQKINAGGGQAPETTANEQEEACEPAEVTSSPHRQKAVGKTAGRGAKGRTAAKPVAPSKEITAEIIAEEADEDSKPEAAPTESLPVAASKEAPEAADMEGEAAFGAAEPHEVGTTASRRPKCKRRIKGAVSTLEAATEALKISEAADKTPELDG